MNVTIAKNALDKSSWITHLQVTDLAALLVNELGPTFPPTGKVYHNSIDTSHDVTPATSYAAEQLALLEGELFIIIWPGGQAVLIQMGVQLAIALTAYIIKSLFFHDEKVTARQLPRGSPNNFPGDRLNTARILERIPDIYGTVKCTPDLIQTPYIHYVNNRQVELSVMCIGQDNYDVLEENIKEGETLISQVPGVSVQIYPSFQLPGGGTPQLTVGTPITDPLYNVVAVKSVKDDLLPAPNATTILGDTGVVLDDDNFIGPVAPLFTYQGLFIGTITFNLANLPGGIKDRYITDKLIAGDRIGIQWRSNTCSIFENCLVDGTGGSINRPNLGLLPETIDDDNYLVTDVLVYGAGDELVDITVEIPGSAVAEWEKIADYNPDGSDQGFSAVAVGQLFPAPIATVYNRGCIIYLLNNRLGPFFVDDPNMQEIHVNVIAPAGLWQDDGVNQHAFGSIDSGFRKGVKFRVEVTPCDVDGIATGPKVDFDNPDPPFGVVPYYQGRLNGSDVSRDLIGQTFVLQPGFVGRFLISIYRYTMTPFREYLRSFVGRETIDRDVFANVANIADQRFGEATEPVFDANTPMWISKQQTQDEIRCTHIYSMSIPEYPTIPGLPLSSLGRITTVHCQRTQRRSVRENEIERRLNMIVQRKVPVYDSTTDTFIGTFGSNRGVDAIFDMLRNDRLGDIDDSQIDFLGIYNAFQSVVDSFTDATINNFSHTFDNKETSLEEMLTAVGESCFVTLFRQGDIIKATPDISTSDSSLLFNHRNKVPGSESRTETFATEEDYDGIEIEYTDNTNNQLQLYTIPGTGIPRNPRKIRLAGVRTRAKAAMHAWRAYNRLLFQNVSVEFEACEEASMGLVQDKVLIANGTRPDTQDGELIGVDGLTIYTSQQALTPLVGDATVFLQNSNGTVNAIGVVQGPDTRSLTLLSAPPVGSIYIDPEGGQSTRYILVSDASPSVQAYRIQDKQQKTVGTYSITAVNYTDGYYLYDGIRLWLPFKPISGATPPILGLGDRSPQEFTTTGLGSSTTVLDTTRQVVYLCTGVGSIRTDEGGFSANSNYTLSCWVRQVAQGTFMIRSRTGSDEVVFLIDPGTGSVQVYHAAVVYMDNLVVEPLNTWKHYGLTYDNDTEILTLYINGEESGIAIDVPGYSSFDGWEMGTLNGRMDSIRIYRKAHTAEFMREMYRREFLP